MATVLADTAIAAANDDSHVNVYAQLTDGTITERMYRNGKWKTSTKNPAESGKAKLFTPLAASIEATDDDDATEWHVYFLDNDNKICEKYWKSGSWTTGYLRPDPICHRVTNGSWTTNVTAMTSTVPLLGTSLTAIDKKVLDQGASFAVEENGGGSVAAQVVTAASPHTSLCAVGNGTYKYIFYTTNKSRLMGEKIDSSGSNVTDITAITPRSSIAAVRDSPSDGDADVIKVYCQRGTGVAISEYRYIEASGWSYRGDV